MLTQHNASNTFNITPHRVLVSDLEKWSNEHAPDLLTFDLDDDDSMRLPDYIDVPTLFRAFLREHGLELIDDTLVFHVHGFPVIRDEIKAIEDSYEGEDETAWKRWNLAGDDDLDYILNVHHVIELLERYLAR